MVRNLRTKPRKMIKSSRVPQVEQTPDERQAIVVITKTSMKKYKMETSTKEVK